MTHPFDGLYGTMQRAVFEERYIEITPAQHRRDTRRAMQQDTTGPCDVLMEEAEGQRGLVTLLPPDAMPYPWRTLWRRKERI